MPTTYVSTTIGDSAIAFGKKQKIWAPKVLQRLLSKTGQKEQAQAYKILIEALEKAGIKYVPSKGGTSAQFTNVTDATIKKFNKAATKLRAEAGLSMSRFQTAEIKKGIKTFVKNKVAAGEYVSRPIILEEFGLDKGSKGWALINRALGNKVGPDTYEGGLLDKLGQTEKATKAVINLQKGNLKRLTASDEILKAINKEFLWNPDVASSEEIAKNIFGDAFPKGDKSKMSRANLLKADRLVTEADNAVMMYLRVLEGKREIPAGMKLPSQKVINDITDNILHGIEDETLPGQGSKRKGFRFSPGVSREYKFAIVEQALGLNSGEYSAAREKFRVKGKVVDEIFSLSTMADKGAGYTTAVQNISAAVNEAKSKKIDGPFQKIINALNEGKKTMQWNYETVPIEEAIKDFNKTSLGFANKHKVRSPKINIGASLPKDLLTTYGPQSQKSIKEVFKTKNYFLSDIKNRPLEMLKRSIGVLSKTNAGGVCNIPSLSKMAGGGRIGFANGSNCARQMEVAFNENPVKVTQEISELPGNKTINTVKNAAKGFLGAIGKFGPTVGKYGAIAAAGAIAQPLVKQFMNDDPATYLTDPEQMKGMLLSTLEAHQPPKPRSEILDWGTTAAGVGATSAAIPGTGAMYKYRRGLLESKIPKAGPVSEAGLTAGDYLKRHGKGFGKLRSGAGVGLKLLSGMYTPAGILATEPLRIAQMRREGESWGEVAKSPTLWMGPAFAPEMSRIATAGMKPGSTLAKALRLGMSPRTLKLISSRFGMPGLALSAGLSGYDLWKDYKKKRGFFAKD